ncbi:Ig-like domain-containing protein [Oxynema aestuarii]|uniref:DUF4347 domain-containing protein n=1 Tax=Oxynema aestuarii AP17 TaxID=2064643 RepID=A0A6H1TU61_9CYAN|nr:malectin domain-containing carbohydrate-binding protein [Oxynema aestuarii]QIZ69746.1 DUF4347 domain-containing protein [Oxynema aestuarii AP17]
MDRQLEQTNKYASGSLWSQIAFIDPSIDDYSVLTATCAANIQVIILNSSKSVVSQIDEALKGENYLEAIHLVTHGKPGELRLGNHALNREQLDRYSSLFKQWKERHPALSILLYGCNVAAGERGARFVERLHEITEAAIAASTRAVGSHLLGGSWELDFKIGQPISDLAWSKAVRDRYHFVFSDPFASDDFNSSSLGTNWTFINPRGDSNYSLTGTGTSDAYLELQVAGGTSHDAWKSSNNSVRVMQGAGNEDFETEVKFASEPSQAYQLQGILVEQDSSNWLRFDTYHNGESLRLFAATTSNNNSQVRIDQAIASGSANYLKLNRQGDLWSLSYSTDGQNWNSAGSFSHSLTANAIGPFAGNAGNSPAFTAQIDYFFNTAAPIVPEDEPLPNQAPVANDDSKTLEPGEAVTVAILDNDSDSDGNLDPSSIAIVDAPSAGTVSIDANGVVTYSHDGSATTADSFTYTVADDDGDLSNLATVNLSIAPNQAPIASDDSASVTIGEAVDVAILDNDNDSDGNLDPSSIAIVDQPSAGTVSIDATTGVVTYSHDGSATTADSFTYTVADDDTAVSNLATVNVSIQEQAIAFASDDFNSSSLGTNWTFINPRGDSNYSLTGTGTSDAYLELQVAGGTSHDAWKSSNNSVRVMQGAGNEDFETEVKFASEPSQAYQLQGILVEQDSSNWLRFDTYHDGESLRLFAATTSNNNSQVRIDQAIASGSANYLKLNRQGDLWSLSYSTDGQNWNSAGSFSHSLTANAIGPFAGNAGNSPAFTAQIDYFFNTAAPIVPEDEPLPNQAPVANDDSKTLEPGEAVTVAILDNDSDSDGNLDPSSIAIVDQPSAGSVSIDATTGVVTYSHDGSATTADSFTYTIADDDGDLSNLATVNLSIAPNQAPIASDDSASVTIGEAVTVAILDNDSDSDGNLDPSSIAIVDQPSAGTVSIDATTGVVTYSHDGSATTADSFTYTVADDDGDVSNLATVNLSIQEPNLGTPIIDVWYGLNQAFGQIGQPQTWVNLLGNVSDPDGIASLSYQLNGGSNIPLSLGPDDRRLQNPGDFNVDIAYSDLDGSVTDDFVTIFATDTLGNTSTQTVSVDYESGQVWPEPYAIDWSAVSNLQDAVQVVDGLWHLEGDTVRTSIQGYDRLLAIGETTWDDYEVTVPVTVNSTDLPSNATEAGVGIMMRWTGHTDDPVPNWQPKSGWNPLGALGWFYKERLEITGNYLKTLSEAPFTLQEGVTYNFKMRAEGNNYKLKVWDANQAEPTNWSLQGEGSSSDPQHGSIVLVAHHYDVSFGDVNITPVGTGSPTQQAPIANNDSTTVAIAGSTTIDVLGNDSDSDGVLLPQSLEIVDAPLYGAIAIDENGVVSYTHDGSGTTEDSFSYRVSDDDGLFSNTAQVAIAIEQNPTPNLTIVESNNSTIVGEDGTTDSYTLVLTTQPTDDVTVTLTPDAQLSAQPSSAIFTPQNWNVAQAVSLAAVDDTLVQGDRLVSLSHAIASNDPAYDNLAVADLDVEIVDDDTPPTPVYSEVRINAGGSAYTDGSGQTWLADTYFNGGDTYTSYAAKIQGTSDTSLYKTERWGDNFGYNIPVENGVYDVNLGFVESYYQQAGQRISDIFAEGELAIDDLDIWTEAGGAKDKLVMKTIEDVAVTDGYLDLNLVSSVSYGNIQSIEIVQPEDPVVVEGGKSDRYVLVLPSQPTENVTVDIGTGDRTDVDLTSVTFTPTDWNVPREINIFAVDDTVVQGSETDSITHQITSTDPVYSSYQIADIAVNVVDNDIPIRINAGGENYTDTFGRKWSADNSFVAGTAYTSERLVGVTPDTLLDRTERYGTDFSYAIAVENGTYDLNLSFIENFFNQAGGRVFDITVEGQLIFDNFDVWTEVGMDTLLIKTIEDIQVSDGVLDVNFKSSASNAFIQGIEVLAAGTGQNNLVSGGFGNNKIFGVDPTIADPGRGEIDELTGLGGYDTFMLGDATTAYYDDGIDLESGLQDYAVIKDFSPQSDVIRLHGTASDYQLGNSPEGLPTGTAIFRQTSAEAELIAIIENETNLNLASSAFQFV